MTELQPVLMLASTSTPRRELIARLGLPFGVQAPQADETAQPGEAPAKLAVRLAQAKAWSVAHALPAHLIIGSDQVAVVGEQVLGKPGNRAAAAAQLALASGRVVHFLTAVCLLNTATGQARTRLVPFEVQMRVLSDRQIERYLNREQPFDCAGALRSEGLGIVLCQRMTGDDPTALLGLPLIALSELLSEEGIALP